MSTAVWCQDGHGRGHKISLGAEHGLISGVIMSPRHTSPDDAEGLIDSWRNLGLDVIFDPQLYLAKTEVGRSSRLPEWEYISGSQTNDLLWIQHAARLALEWQRRAGFNKLVVSGPSLPGFDSTEAGILETVIGQARAERAPVLVTICIQEPALRDRQQMNDWLTRATSWAHISGFYVVVDWADVPYGLPCDAEWIANFLEFVFALKLNGFEVILGHTGIWAVLCLPLRVDVVATGWGLIQRRLSTAALSGRSGARAPLRRVWSYKWLSELTRPQVEQLPPPADGSAPADESTEGQLRLGMLSVLSDPTTEVLHNWKVLSRLSQELSDFSGPIRQGFNRLRAKLEEAKATVASFSGGQLPDWAQHLPQWRHAVDLFEERKGPLLDTTPVP